MPVCICPHCQARYNIPAAKLGPNGRNVKCAKCGNQFFAAPEVIAEAAPATTQTPQNTIPAEQSQPQSEPNSPQNTSEIPSDTTNATPPQAVDLNQLTSLKHQPNWFRSLKASPFVLLGLAAVAFTALALYSVMQSADMPEEITPLPAETQPADAYLPTGLALSDLTRDLVQQGDTWILTVSGMVTNNTEADTKVPEIRVQLLDPNNIALDFWPAEVAARTLGPGQSSSWQARFLNPPVQRLASFRAYFRDPDGTLATAAAEKKVDAAPAGH